MAVFSGRHRLYKTGVVLLLLSAVMAAWGVIAPGWLRFVEFVGVTAYSGLWFVCQNGFYGCSVVDFSLADASTYAILVLSCLGLFLLLCSSLVLLYSNFCATVQSHSRSAEALALLGGVGLFAGCMVFVRDAFSLVTQFPAVSYGPSFVLSLVASLTSAVACVLMAVYSRRAAAASIDTVIYWPTTRLVQPVQYPAGYLPQQAPGTVYYGNDRTTYATYQTQDPRDVKATGLW